MPQHDQLHRYLFENFAVRGELVTVSETLQQILRITIIRSPLKRAGRTAGCDQPVNRYAEV